MSVRFEANFFHGCGDGSASNAYIRSDGWADNHPTRAFSARYTSTVNRIYLINTSNPSAMIIDRLDHIVMTVKSLDVICEFYARVLGMRVVSGGDNSRALSFGKQKINLHQQGDEAEPKALTPTPGSADLCFITTEPMPEVLEHLRRCGVDTVEGPVTRTGALGPMLSIYFRDPERNLLEVSKYLSE